MGIIVPDDSRRSEIEAFRLMLLSCAGTYPKKDGYDPLYQNTLFGNENPDVRQTLVGVTSAVSFLGIAIVKELLQRGYLVRLILDSEDAEMSTELEVFSEMTGTTGVVEVFRANLSDADSVSEAINGCSSVFHTAAFIDPAGISGYSKSMAEVEVKVSENVIKACAMSPSVRNCVLTSSLLACIWRPNSLDDPSCVMDHGSWSDESLCLNRKLWYALGKLKAEQIAWRVSKDNGLNMATICPALITGSDFCRRNSTSTIAYLKGVEEMYANGLLATVDVNKLAEAHISVFEALNTRAAFGRYICYDQIVRSEEEVNKLAQETGINTRIVSEDASSHSTTRFKLSNLKLSRLMSRTVRCND